MTIDWFTFTAQIVNFLVLVVLLHRFLYAPVLGAMQKREETIASRFSEAEQLKAEVEREADEYRRLHEEHQRKREEMLAEVRAEVEAHRKELLHELREEVEQQRRDWQAAVERDRQLFLHEARRRAVEQVQAIARRLLTTLAGVDLEAAMVEVFLTRLRSIDRDEREQIASGLRDNRHLVVQTAFELPEKTRERIEAAVHELFGDHSQIRFETDAETICGIELVATGHKVAWSFDEGLSDLEERLGAALADGRLHARSLDDAAARK